MKNQLLKYQLTAIAILFIQIFLAGQNDRSFKLAQKYLMIYMKFLVSMFSKNQISKYLI